ncbi:MAG: GTP-binding DUF697 domain-containing protein [Clostridiales bacterium]|nr:GTP-binding DUF697 domain-containing protein [Clostridiales bacterium]
MKKANVLFLGNSGVGKSTLINAIMNDDAAETGIGITGTTKELKTYENDEVPFRIIDTIGFEPTKLFQKNKAINEVQKWSKDVALSNIDDTSIDLICLCVDGTSSKLFAKTIDDFLKAISIWKTVPVIVIITKSYSFYDREANRKMVNDAFAGKTCNLKGIFTVVAQPYVISDEIVVPPEGITELISAINELLPEGIQASKKDINTYNLNRKRVLAHGATATFTGIGVAIGAIPIPFPDAALLIPTETAEINLLAKIYGIKQDEKSKMFFNSIVEVGTVSAVARGVITALKAIPAINIAVSVLNAVIAGVFVAAIGEGTIYAFEQIYLGHKSIEDIDWVKQLMEGKLKNGTAEKVTKILESLPENAGKNDVIKAIGKLFGVKDSDYTDKKDCLRTDQGQSFH